MIWFAFILGIFLGFGMGLVLVALMTTSARRNPDLDKFEAAQLAAGIPGDPAAGYHPDSLSDPRD
jgi:hypothetical protein